MTLPSTRSKFSTKLSKGVFVDTGAWIALAVVGDPYHERAVAIWDSIHRNRLRIVTSVPVVIETFTYLDRKGNRDLALRWKRATHDVARFMVADCHAADIENAWAWLERRDFHKLSLVDATSFVLMQKLCIRRVFGFDAHFAQAGFSYAA